MPKIHDPKAVSFRVLPSIYDILPEYLLEKKKVECTHSLIGPFIRDLISYLSSRSYEIHEPRCLK